MRVRSAIGAPRAAAEIDAMYGAIPRTYVQSATLSAAEQAELLTDRLVDYDAEVHECGPDAVAETIAAALQARGKTGALVPPAFPADWLPADFDFNRDPDVGYDAMDVSQGVLTDCALAIAETGTIVLRHSTERGRRALTLVPDYLLCVIRKEQIVQTVPEAIRQMASFAAEPLTTISGPSATADIEMTRIKGVHGPRTLEVVLVG